MSTDLKALTKFKGVQEMKVVLATDYKKQVENYFGDEKKALQFFSSVVSAVQRTPALLDCTPVSLINSFIMMAELELMPSGVSGEAYVLPYKSKNGTLAQFQLGYQGLITLFYRAKVTGMYAEIVRENDEFEILTGKIIHKIDHKKSMAQRGEAIGAWAIGIFNGQPMSKYMHRDDIIAHAKKFSKSFSSEYSPWNEKNDPELWMWKKTVIKQLGKLLPKNETINKAIGYDNQDSNISDKVESAKKESTGLEMGNLLKDGKAKNKEVETKIETEDETNDAASFQANEDAEIIRD